MPTCRSWKTGLEFWTWRPYKVRSLVSNSIYDKKDRNGPPSANQVASKDEPRCGHAVCTLRVHPPTSPCPALSAHTEPKSQGHCRKWHHEAESLMKDISAICPKELIVHRNCLKRGSFLFIIAIIVIIMVFTCTLAIICHWNIAYYVVVCIAVVWVCVLCIHLCWAITMLWRIHL